MSFRRILFCLKSVQIRTMAIMVFIFAQREASAQSTVHLDDRSDYVAQASQQFNVGRWDAGKQIIDEGLEKYPKYSDLKMLSGKYYYHIQQYDKARYELQKALEQNPDNVDAKQILVNVEMDSKRYSSAICYVNELLEVNPYWEGLWRKKIELYRLQGNDVEADRLLKRISQIYPNDTTLRKDFLYHTELEANRQSKQGNIDAAIALNTELARESPRNIDYYFNVINDYIKAGDQYNALAYTERALLQFPGNFTLIRRKASLLADQKRYNEALTFLQQQMKGSNYEALRQEYSYYLLEAARNSKGNETATLYGKILESQPGNKEAFTYVFNDVLSKQQYDEALSILNKYRSVSGASKELSLKELLIYQRMGDNGKATAFTKELFGRYPDDADLRDAYVKIVMTEAREQMVDEQYSNAIKSWNEVWQYGDSDMVKTAKNAIYNAYIAMGDYDNALNTLTEIMQSGAVNPDDYVKRAEIYMKQQRYHNAMDAYEHAIAMADGDKKARYIGGYSEMLIPLIKELNEQYHYEDAMEYVKRWLVLDSANADALSYAVNLSYSMGKQDDMKMYAQRGLDAYPDNIFFKIKLAQVDGLEKTNYARTFAAVANELIANPYHKDLINVYSEIGVKYAEQLIKEKDGRHGLAVLDSVLRYDPGNKLIKYDKGLAFEQLHNFDSAYYYQSFYEPSLMELSDFRQHLYYLQSKTYKNSIGLYHLRSRLGDDYSISTISTIEYSHFDNENTYTGRINYAGRDSGKGYQLQAQWDKVLNERTRTQVDAAWANNFFPSVVLDASVFRSLQHDWELQGGVGYRRLPGSDNLYNLVVGATKELEPWRLNAKFNNFVLNKKWLYNLSAEARYYLNSPKNYLMAVSSIGSSPDVDVLNYQFYNGFSVLNTMVGAGAGYLLFRTVSAGVLGTWYNYRYNTTSYKNLYNIYLQLNVFF